MNPSSCQPMVARASRGRQAGFTLVELLIAITVIAILAGMLTVAVFPVLTTAREAAITLEVKQIEMALEQFKTKYGFYPPSFEGLTALEFAQYVNRMSANHNELSASGVGSTTRLEHWWDQVGQHLDQESSLVFWLSGICLNKQYPITGGVAMSAGVPPLAAHGYANDGIERDGMYEFRTSQLVGDDPGEVVNKGAMPIPASAVGFILEYEHAHAGTDGEPFTSPGGQTGVADYRIKYRDFRSYDLGGGNTAYYQGPVTGESTLPMANFINPKSFQLITFGMDGLPGVPGNIFASSGDPSNWTVGGVNFFGPWGDDNICNFSEGRLQKYVLERQ